MSNLDLFLNHFKTDAGLKKASEEQLSAFAEKLPKDLLSLWAQVGLGSFGDGYLHFFDPRLFSESFSQWILNSGGGRIPFARNAFGQFYYWRIWSDEAADASYLDVNTSQNGVLAYTFDLFLAEMVKTDATDRWRTLYREARIKLPAPTEQQSYILVPALRLGGKMSVENIEVGNANVQMQFLRRLI